jgi:hypothetical protein
LGFEATAYAWVSRIGSVAVASVSSTMCKLSRHAHVRLHLRHRDRTDICH